jgi:glycerol-3-phosphate O-acyltransferase
MLGMTVRSFLRDTRRPVAYVPVYFGYDKLLEGETYIDELMGRPKEKESVGGMLGVLPELRKPLGRVYVAFGEPLLLDGMLDQVHEGWRASPPGEDARPAWFGDAVDAVAAEIMRRINAAAAVTPVNLVSVVLLAAPRQAMIEADLERQLQLYIELLRGSPYSPDVSIAVADGPSIIRQVEKLGMLERRPHKLGDVLRMDERNAVLATYYRNNVLHLFAMPSLVACAFLNNSVMRHEDIQRLLWRVYPYVRAELNLRWREEELPGVVDGVLAELAKQGLLERGADGATWRRSTTGSAEAVRLSVLAQATIQTIERYYLAIALLLRSGRSTLTPEALEQRCVAMAQRMAMLYGLAAPEFFDKAMFRDFIDLLRQRGVVRLDGDGKLTYDDALLAVADDARVVLSEQIRNSILQVTHS